ncbi:tetraspanin-18B-like [Festucalex cinctus]
MGHGEASARGTTVMAGDCVSCVKYLMLIFNTFLVMAGCFLLGVGLLVLFGTAVLSEMLMQHPVLSKTVFAVLGIGSLLFLLGFVGCCGALRENRCLLFFFFMLIFVVFIAELAAGVWAYTQRQKFFVEDLQKEMREKYQGYAPDDKYTTIWNKWMVQHECCGINGFEDFEGSLFRRKYNHTVPTACCLQRSQTGNLEHADRDKCLKGSHDHINVQGCYRAGFKTYEVYLYLAGALFILVLTFELLAMSVAMCLFRGLQSM